MKQQARHARGWRKKWRPAGGWALLIAVVALTGGFSVGGLIAYHVVSQPVNPRVIQQPAPSASTHYVIVRPVVSHTARPHTASPSIGQADIPGVTPYYRPTPTLTPTRTAQSRAPPTPTPTPTLTPTTEVPTSAPSDTGSPSASVTFPASPF